MTVTARPTRTVATRPAPLLPTFRAPDPRPAGARPSPSPACSPASCRPSGASAVSLELRQRRRSADHRFHQVTGQGLLLCALWLGRPGAAAAGRLARRRAVRRGRSRTPALFAGAGLAVGLLAPGAGGLPVAVVTVVTDRAALGGAAGRGPAARAGRRARPGARAGRPARRRARRRRSSPARSACRAPPATSTPTLAHYFDMAWIGGRARPGRRARRRGAGRPAPGPGGDGRPGAHRRRPASPSPVRSPGRCSPSPWASSAPPPPSRDRRPSGEPPSVRLPLPHPPAPAAAHPDRVRGGALAAAVPRGRRVGRSPPAGSVLAVARRRRLGPRRSAASLPVDVVVGIAYPLVGALVLAGRRGRAGGSAGCCSASGGRRAHGVADHRRAARRRHRRRTARLAVQLQSWLWVPGFLPLLTLLPLLYPDGLLARAALAWRGRRGGRRHRAAHRRRSPLPSRRSFDGQRRHRASRSPRRPVATALLPVGGCSCAARRRAGRLAASWSGCAAPAGCARRQVVVLAGRRGASCSSTPGAGALLPAPVGARHPGRAVALVPVAVGVAVTRHRLYDLDLAVCRALVGVSLAVCLAGVYLTVFARAATRRPGRTALAGGASPPALTGLLVQPLGRRLARGVDRLFYGDRADPYAVLRPFSAAAAATARRRRGARRRLRRGRRLAAAGAGVAASLDGRRGGRRHGRAARPDRPPTVRRCATAASVVGVGSPSRRGPASRRSTPGTPSCSPRSPTRPRPRVAALRLHRRAAAQPRGAGRRPARRSAAACAATCTTASARRWPALRLQLESARELVADARRRRAARRRGAGPSPRRSATSAGITDGPAPAGARRPRAGRQPARARRPAPHPRRCAVGVERAGALPAAARRRRGRLLPDRRRGAGQRRPARRRAARSVVRLARRGRRAAARGRRRRPRRPRRSRDRGSGLGSPRCGSGPRRSAAAAPSTARRPGTARAWRAPRGGARDDRPRPARRRPPAVPRRRAWRRSPAPTTSRWSARPTTSPARSPARRAAARRRPHGPQPAGRLGHRRHARRRSASCPATRVLVMTMSDDDEAVVAAMRAGARGYVVKGAGRGRAAARRAHRGRRRCGLQPGGRRPARRLVRRAWPPCPARSRSRSSPTREREVLDLVARGYDNRRIARELFLSDKTVRNHVSNVLTKLDVDRPRRGRRAGRATPAWAPELGWVGRFRPAADRPTAAPGRRPRAPRPRRAVRAPPSSPGARRAPTGRASPPRRRS